MNKNAFPDLVLKAILFAEECHRGQMRRDGFPYIVHPLGVSKLMWESPWEFTEEEYAAAILHDVIEESDTTFEDIHREFGQDVAGLVWLLSKPEQNGMSREIYFIALKRCSPTVIAIKLADICHNLSCMDVPEQDKEWSQRFLMKVKKYGVPLIHILKMHGECWREYSDWIGAKIERLLNENEKGVV